VVNQGEKQSWDKTSKNPEVTMVAGETRCSNIPLLSPTQRLVTRLDPSHCCIWTLQEMLTFLLPACILCTDSILYSPVCQT